MGRRLSVGRVTNDGYPGLTRTQLWIKRITICLITIRIPGREAMFINREAELAHLEQLYHSDQAELFILYAGGVVCASRVPMPAPLCRSR